jgi:hypothetical protein
MGDVIIIKRGEDLAITNSITIGSNINAGLPGMIIYNKNTDQFEGYLNRVNQYNNSHWAPMSLDIASASNLGGIKVGNNLAITGDGTLNATASSISRKTQRVLIVNPAPGAGDYTSIGQCIHNFFGYDSSTGTYPSGELSFFHSNSSTNYPYPGPEARYIILVSPGIYNETIYGTIDMPPYTTLKGDGMADCVVKMNALVSLKCRESSVISDLTFDLSSVTTVTATGISLPNPGGAVADNVASNVTLANITFITDNCSKPTSLISLSGVNNANVNNLYANITDIAKPSPYTGQTLTGVTASGSTATLTNCSLTLESNQTSKFIIDASQSSTITTNNCDFTVAELNTSNLSSHYNSGFRLINSSMDMSYSMMNVTGYDDSLATTTRKCYGLEMQSTTSIYSTSISSGSGLRFIHYDASTLFDEIVVPTSVQDFTLYFNTNDYIKVSGSASGANDGVVRIVNVFNETRTYTTTEEYSVIQIAPSYNFVSQSATANTITLKVLYAVNLYNSQITSTNESLVFTGSTGQENYNILVSRTNLLGADPACTSNKLVFNSPFEIWVGREASDYSSIAAALSSIQDASSIRPYIVHVKPGIYYESTTLIVPEYVTVLGESAESTKVYFDSNTGGSGYYTAQNCAITLTNNTALKNISVYITNDLDTTKTQLIAIGGSNLNQPLISASSLTNIVISGVLVSMSSDITVGTRSAIQMNKSSYKLSAVTIISTISATSDYVYGIKQALGTGIFDNVSVSIAGAVNNISCYGVYSDRAYIKANNTQIQVNGNGASGCDNYGIYVTNTVDTTPSGITISPYNTVLYGGYVKAIGGVTNTAFFVDYHSTLVAMSLLTQGDYTNFETVIHSFMRLINCQSITDITADIITNTQLEDYAGRPMIALNSLYYGANIGAPSMSGTKNIIIGVNTGTSNQLGSRNIYLGVETGQTNNTGNDNVYLGQGAGNTAVGSNSVIIGSEAGGVLTVGNDNTLIGSQAGSNLNTASRVTVLGTGSAANAAGITDTVVVGFRSGTQLTNSTNNIIMGSQSANSMSSGSRNMVIGNESAKAITSQSDNMIIGHTAAQALASGIQNTVIGNNAGQNIQSGTDNTLVGFQAGRSAVAGTPTGNKNTVIGSRAAINMTSASDSVVIGTAVAQSLTSGARNIVVGSEQSGVSGSAPGDKLTTGNDNLIMGVNSAANLTIGQRNVVLGNQNAGALDGTSDTIIIGYGSGSNISGSAGTDGQNIIIGNLTGQNITSGRTILIGHQAGQNASGDDLVIIGNLAGRTISGPRNTLIGNYAAGVSSNPNSNPVLGADNIMIGTYAGFQIQTGSYNTIIGSGDGTIGGAGYNITSGSYNLLFGYRAGRNVSIGSQNILVGSNAGATMRESNRNLILGNEAGRNLGANDTTVQSNDNLIIGNSAAFNTTQANKLLAIGQNAAYNSITTENSTVIGNDAGYQNITGIENTYIGNFAGRENLQSQNTMIGTSAGRYTQTAEHNTYVGYESGRGDSTDYTLNTGDKNTAFGFQAGKGITSGYQNVYAGYRAGEDNLLGSKNIAMGSRAGQNASGSQNIFIGTSQIDADGSGIGAVTSGNYDIFIGTDTGINNTTGAKNIAIGYQAGRDNTSGDTNIFVGESAGRDNTTGLENINIGKNAGLTNTDGDNNIIIGTSTGSAAGSNKNDVVLIGTFAGQHNNANASIFIGKYAGKLNTSGEGNILIGPDAGSSNELSSKNIMIGRNAGTSLNVDSTEGQNIIIGDNSAAAITTGIHNIAIGADSLADSGVINSTIAIGYEAGKNIGNRSLTAGGDANRNIIIGYQAASNGDVNSDNILIGTQVAQHVDNPITFEGNLIMGSLAGYNANFAVNSIAIGNANRIGDGGVTNILMGTAAGDNVGNPLSTETLTRTQITSNGLSVTINKPVTQAYRYFKDGDTVLIRSSDASFQVEIASIKHITGDTANSTIIFANRYPGPTTIDINSSVKAIAVLQTDVGATDASKSSGNSLVGDNAGNMLTTGSKNIAFGTQAMNTNQIGRYNNIVGTQAGYNIVSDNNTLLGTRAGYSLDIAANTVAFTATDLVFASNANAIYSTTLSNLGDYEYGTVIDIGNTTDNDGRYTVELGVNQPTDQVPSYMIIEGNPIYEELGIPDTVPPNAIKVSAAKYTVLNQGISGTNVNSGWFTHNGNTYNGIYTTIASDFFDNIQEYGGVIFITGSQYNDGLHYIDVATSRLLPTGYIATHDYFIVETFAESVNITVKCIVADTITGANDFTDFNYNNSMNMFFTINKGVYTASPLTKKYQISMPDNSATYILGKAFIFDNYNQDNIIFGTGYKNKIQFATNETSTNYQVFEKLIIDASIFGGGIFFINNVITITQIANYGPVVGEYYDIEAYDNGTLVYGSQIILIDSIEEYGGELRYIINSAYPLPANGFATQMTFKKCQIKQLVRSLTDEFAAGDIVLINTSHEYGLKTERGAFMIRSALSPSQTDNRLLIRCEDTIPDMYYSLYETQDKLWDSDGSYSSSMQSNTAGISSTSLSNLTQRIYQTNNYADSALVQDPSKQIAGWGIFSQNETITASGSNVYTCYAGNNTITAGNQFEFAKLVAPCYISISDPSVSYYVVKENKWPFNKLVIDSTSGTLNSTTITSVHIQSISSRFDTSNLTSISNSFIMFGINNPTEEFESIPIEYNKLYASTSAVYSNYILAPEFSPVFTVNGYDTVMTIAAYDSTTTNNTPGWIGGYFKYANVTHSNVDITPAGIMSNLTVTFNNPNATVISNLSNLDIGDIVKLDDGIINYGYCELLTTVSNTYPSYSFNIQYTPGVIVGPGHIGTTANIICNEYRATPTLIPEGATVNYNFRNARTLVGTNSDFLRFSQLRTLDFAPYSTNQRDIYVTDATYNFATCTMDASNSVSILSNNVVYLRETVPNEYGDLRTSNLTANPNKYIISIGTPTLDPGNNITLQAQNIQAKPTGFIDVLVNNTGVDGNSSVNWILNSNVDALLGNVTIDTTAHTIAISNIAPDMVYGGSIPFRNDGVGLVNKVSNTFDNILPGTYVRIWDASHNDTYLVTGKTDSLTLEYDPTFYNPAATETIAFTGGSTLRIDYGFSPDLSVANGIYPLISGQVISDRIDFNQFGSISPYNPSNTAPVANYLAVHRLPVFSLEGLNNAAFYVDEYFYYFNNYKIYDGSFKLLSNAYVASTSNSTLDFHYSGGVNNRTLMYDIGDHVLILPASNIKSHIVNNIEFINFTGSYNVEFLSSAGNKYIYNSAATFPVVKLGQIVKVTGSTVNDGYYLTSNTISSTSSQIYIDQSYKDFTVAVGSVQSITLDSNVIYSANVNNVDLSVYKPGQSLKVEKTSINDTIDTSFGNYRHIAKVISSDTETRATCVYVSYPVLTNESGYYCKISKCILNDETSNIILSDVATNFTLTNMDIGVQSNSFALFRDGQTLNISNISGQIGTIIVNGQPDVLDMDITVLTNIGLTSGLISYMAFTKPITFKKIGTPISTVTTDGVVKFHYLDAQGNNLMLGSFTGQFAGATGLSIHNAYIGNRVGQTNQGSGNILLGNESGFAQVASDGATSYNNKFAVYKNNFIGVPSNPLIGGDFASNRVGINTIDPDNLLTNVLDTATRMVVNGKVRAQAYNTFTGTHIITLEHNSNVQLEQGMLLCSTGNVNILALIDTIVHCRICVKPNDKTLFGIYAGSEFVNDKEIFYCASVGEGCILVTNYNGAVENGDYISSGPIPGYGQKQADDLLHNYTIAKITEDINWDTVTQYIMYEGHAYKRALVACTYHCG